MTAPHLKNLVIEADEVAPLALWKTIKTLGRTSCVLDKGVWAGTLTTADFPVYSPALPELRAGDLCSRPGLTLEDGPYLFVRARDIFNRRPSIKMIPVLDRDRQLVEVIFKFQAFYEDYFREPDRFHSLKPQVTGDRDFPYMYYAHCLWRAAAEARRNQYPAFSALEFGVAGGNGLICAQWHARAIAKIFGLTIELYGFDTGRGLPPLLDYRDLPHVFGPDYYAMDDQSLLRERLNGAQLVIGDIRETVPTFLDQFRPAPIGVMLIDVDTYHSALAALNLLNQSEEYFLPRVQMYFDDICFGREESGEALAIRDFNAQGQFIKIAPETTYTPPTETLDRDYNSFLYRLKEVHRFQHPLYSRNPNQALNQGSTRHRFRIRY